MTIVLEFMGAVIFAVIFGVGAYKVIEYLTSNPPKPPKE